MTTNTMTKPAARTLSKEEVRLEESRLRKNHWKRWGPYLSERQWGTVREDYSAGGTAWDFLPHDHARSRAYRWGEDGLAGISDRHQLLCFAIALWNGRDPILKERAFGLSNPEGNHGEDVKDYYFYLDATPTSSYLKYLYKYPQRAFPYADLVEENRRRGRGEPEYELLDTGAFHESRYFDVFVEYAKASPEDIGVRITVHNRGPEEAKLELLPTLWFRNTWSWGGDPRKPSMAAVAGPKGAAVIEAEHHALGTRHLVCSGAPELLFTENETNNERLYGVPNAGPYVKDGIDAAIVRGHRDTVRKGGPGTKAAARYALTIPAGGAEVVVLRLTDETPRAGMLGRELEEIFETRLAEANEFYARRHARDLTPEARSIQRQAFAGLLWGKQFYHYDVRSWLTGDPAGPAPPENRTMGRNREWMHLYNEDIVSMPDKWEYPWYAAWDLAFHCIPLAQVDPDFAKEQLLLLLREWYMHPNGQLPAYEWAFGDVNPPVHAWAAWRVYKIERRIRGRGDLAFLEKVFHKLLLNFTWWLNKKDAEGNSLFQGGFLGMDNIGVFDRSAPLPTGGHIEQSDGTSWMGMYCLNLLAIALELARHNAAYEDIASKFFEHFVTIAGAMNSLGPDGIELWDEADGFYYDVLHVPPGGHRTMNVRSMVGLIPLFAVETLEPDLVDRLPGFKRRMAWFLANRPETRELVEIKKCQDGRESMLLSIVPRTRITRVLSRMLDENEFLSRYGVRALSRWHEANPYMLEVNGTVHAVRYEPGESSTGAFGGNSNWRGPIWFPVNFLLIESLQRFHHHFGDDLLVECPARSGRHMNLWDVAAEISRRLVSIFLPDAEGLRPVHRRYETFAADPHWRDLMLFYEYFNGDDGSGVGANHQTGWTALVAKLIEQRGA